MTTMQTFYPKRILSSSTTGDLLDGITRSLEAGIANILVDFQHVMFMDSTGLSALVVALKRVRAVNGRLALCHLNGQAYMVLEHSGLDKVFEIYEAPEGFDRALANSPGEPLAK
ncbi:STAS domain-containing protein [Stenomitos frigidus]|uniref:Anti-sigma factor antagonist n=1 Tax=Stenomitos frigidus ULC18 TaxID=2107698 RepID=A0A2T1E6V9_9CYAN|nr:STAS domain-containing protein [Stenomitos frigidus]PSB28470.1 anti-sigma factor antagonist [Stenomitos frigidus ULC18]